VARKGFTREFVLAGAVTLAYANGLRGDFQFDDYTVIVHNPAVRDVFAWATSMPGIRPLLKLSYALNWSSGLGPAGFHAVNLVCHLAAALLAMRLCGRLARASGALAPIAGPLAFTAGLIFALHPAQTEAVTYLSGRSMSLMGALYLGAVTLHLGGGNCLPSLALFALALATKETAVTLPVALVLADGALGVPWARAWRRSLPSWMMLGAALAAGLALPGYRRLLAFSVAIRPIGENLLTEISGVWYLLTQPLLLLRTNIDPPLAPHTGLTVVLVVQGCLLLAMAVAGMVMLRRQPPLGAAILWFFLHLAPTNSLLPRLDVANDRQLYLAILGPAFLLAAGLWSWLPRRTAVAAAAGLALVLLAATVLRNADYRTEVALWRATVAASPENARAWNNLGYAYQLAGEPSHARDAYRRALDLDPRGFRAYWNLETLADPAFPASR
jgi:protein O-mannosyl-transferase